MISAINSVQNDISFGASRKPKTFGQMMNYIYRQTSKHYGDVFENRSVVKMTTNIDGKDVTGFVSFRKGRYKNFVLDMPFRAVKGMREKFMETALNNYLKKISGKRSKACHMQPNKRLNKHQIMSSAYEDRF